MEDKKVKQVWLERFFITVAIVGVLGIVYQGYKYFKGDNVDFIRDKIETLESKVEARDSIIQQITIQKDSIKAQRQKIKTIYVNKSKTIKDDIDIIRKKMQTLDNSTPNDIPSREFNLARICDDRGVSTKID